MKLNDKARLVTQRLQGQLTNREYASASIEGQTCPFCKRQGGLTFENDEEYRSYRNTYVITFRTECTFCKKTWNDAFRLIGYVEEDEDINPLIGAEDETD